MLRAEHLVLQRCLSEPKRHKDTLASPLESPLLLPVPFPSSALSENVDSGNAVVISRRNEMECRREMGCVGVRFRNHKTIGFLDINTIENKYFYIFCNCGM
jgi:hypothetical protein